MIKNIDEINKLIDDIKGDQELPEEYTKKYCTNSWFPCGHAWLHWFFDTYKDKIFKDDDRLNLILEKLENIDLAVRLK